MKRFCQNLGAAVLAVIPITAFLIMWEVVDIHYRVMGWFVVSYLTLVLVLLGWEIVRDLLQWLRR